MTAKQLKENAVPASVVLGILAITAQALGLIPQLRTHTDPDLEAIRNRITMAEARQVEFERQWREDRNEIMRVLYTIQGDLRRVEGKMENSRNP